MILRQQFFSFQNRTKPLQTGTLNGFMLRGQNFHAFAIRFYIEYAFLKALCEPQKTIKFTFTRT